MSLDSVINQAKERENGPESEDKETGRLEAFSDGVFAVAITLLVLDLKVPPFAQLTPAQGLGSTLLNEWPAYLAYVTSFLTILIMWINHHNLFRQIKLIDHTFLLINGLLLMLVTVIPFPTSLLVEYIQTNERTTAAAVYSGTNIVLAILFATLWFYASYNNRLLDKKADPVAVRNISNQYRLGPLFYLVTFIVAFINAWISVGLCLLLALFFALPSSVVASNKTTEEANAD